ncbi:MAG: glycosyltransferase family 4 protein [Thermoleophilaceae bacterium]
MTRIHQVLSGAGPVDAVTTQAVEYRKLFSRWGMEGGIHAAAIEPAVRAQVEPLRRLRPGPGDVLLFHYSAYAPRLEPLLELPQRKLLVYHNVTPAGYLWEHQPHVATLCALGRDHLPGWAQSVDVAAAVSEYNAAELRAAGADDVRVIPILRHRSKGSDQKGSDPFSRVVSIGRLSPHKRPDLVLRAFELYRSACAPDARLVMVGEPLSPGYEAELRGLAGEGVTITGRLAQDELDRLWSQADVLLTLSEHEGFCVPLLEAFDAGVPVIARPVGGMPEVGGDAVLWAEDDDLAVVAELIDLATRDDELRAELADRGRRRLEEFAPERVEPKLRAAIDTLLQ